MKSRHFLGVALALAAFVGVVALAMYVPEVHAGTLAAAGVAAGVASNSAPYGSYDYWHQARNNNHAAKNSQPVFTLRATSDDYPDGIMEKSGPWVKLLVFEDLRAQCASAAQASLQALGPTIPEWWAYDAALNSPNLSFTDAERFNVITNCAKAEMQTGMGGGYYSVATDNTPDPSGRSRWIEGPTIPNTAGLATHIDTPAELVALAQSIAKRSALQL